MKKIYLFLFTAAFALTLGAAFADESMPMSGPVEPVISNGITHFDLGPAGGCSAAMEESGISGSGAGGGEGVAAKTGNGVTHFDLGRLDKGAVLGACVSGTPGKGPSASNGITQF